jgi:hypothetical protein
MVVRMPKRLVPTAKPLGPMAEPLASMAKRAVPTGDRLVSMPERLMLRAEHHGPTPKHVRRRFARERSSLGSRHFRANPP